MMLECCRRRRSSPTVNYTVDPAGVLFRSGAHKPLLVYVGSLPRVSSSSSGPAKAGAPTRPAAPTVVGVGAGMIATGSGTGSAEAGFLEGSRA